MHLMADGAPRTARGVAVEHRTAATTALSVEHREDGAILPPSADRFDIGQPRRVGEWLEQ